ncbi:hypothetical protein AVEN_11097-1 [Araneus ventricosus]|uniref:Transposable element P transposase n=1 Tax=Araneus ventricosus TaxID=182803 RepID=A0A4Y2MGK0_ARAVE|nr:hypothetical protein AVEN_11097-1 [Araneus ventricosus]
MRLVPRRPLLYRSRQLDTLTSLAMGAPSTDPHKPSITGWQVTLSAFLLLVHELFEEKKFVLLSRFNQDALENYFSQVRRMTIPLQWTSCTRTRMLLAELMFTMCGNANYEPDDNIILESTQIILQTDEDCLDLVIDEPSWIAQKHRKIGMIWSSTVPLMWQATFQKKLQKIYCELCKSNICQQLNNCHYYFFVI